MTFCDYCPWPISFIALYDFSFFSKAYLFDSIMTFCDLFPYLVGSIVWLSVPFFHDIIYLNESIVWLFVTFLWYMSLVILCDFLCLPWHISLKWVNLGLIQGGDLGLKSPCKDWKSGGLILGPLDWLSNVLLIAECDQWLIFYGQSHSNLWLYLTSLLLLCSHSSNDVPPPPPPPPLLPPNLSGTYP